MPTDYGDRLFNFVKALNIPFLYERSFKLMQQTLYDQRFLLTLYLPALKGEEQHFLQALAALSNIPEPYRKLIESQIVGLRELHIGFEQQEKTSVCKVYLERPLLASNGKPQLVHQACKWSIESPESMAIDSYHLIPVASRDEILTRIVGLSGSVNPQGLDTVKQLFLLAGDNLTLDELFYLEVEDQAKTRSSFDMKFYDAELTMGQVEPVIYTAADYFAVPATAIEQLLATQRDKVLGHVSSGLGRNKQAFVTYYYGVQAM